MVLQCFKWIMHLVNESIGMFSFSTKSGAVGGQLPDDVIVDILSRLPAERVLECRRVCRRWRSLTSSQYFVKLHLSKVTTAEIFLNYYVYLYMENKKSGVNFFIYDPTMTKGKKLSKLRLRPEIVMAGIYTTLYDSCNGLLLFRNAANTCHCIVFNPVTQEQIIIDCCSPGYVWGFFYNPRTSKYNILYHGFFGHEGWGCFVYTLGGRAWRNIKSPAFDHAPSHHPPAICNGALHWISNWNNEKVEKMSPCTSGILIFDMNTEEFSTKSHPRDECKEGREHRYMSVFATNGSLFFYHLLCIGKRCLDIWAVEDYSNWAWVPKWKLDLLPEETSFSWTFNCYSRIVQIQDGQLLLDCFKVGLFVHDLENNNVWRLEEPRSRPNERTNDYHQCAILTKSLVSLRQLSSDTEEV